MVHKLIVVDIKLYVWYFYETNGITAICFCCVILFHPACGTLHRSELCSSELMQYKSATQRKFNSYSVAGVHKNFTSPTSYHPCVE